MREGDLIAAISTGGGEGGIAIVRASGAGAHKCLDGCFLPAHKRPGAHARMEYGHITDENGRAMDEVMAVRFFAPNSYTRENVIEIHCHGGRACARAVLARLLSLGARPARPGEFTRRAFENGRVDLSEAEAVMQMISARSEAALRAGARQLAGGVSARAGGARKKLTELLALIAACTDFPEEIDEPAAAETVLNEAKAIREALARACDERYARIVREGASVVLAGRPNVGKSSVMNALLCCERAIVASVPGTTRDVLTESVEMDGVRYALSDTAGLRETGDPVEQIGVARAREALSRADCVVLLLDGSAPLQEEDEALLRSADARYIVALNKCDMPVVNPAPGLRVSARTGMGMDALAREIAKIAGADALDEDRMTLPRHIECAQRAMEALLRAIRAIESGVPLDFAHADLSEALNALGDITGETMNEKVIDQVFASFCVGK